MRFNVILFVLVAVSHVMASESIESLHLNWRRSLDAVTNPGKDSHSKVVAPLFESFFSDWSRQEMRGVLPLLAKMEEYFAIDVLSHLMRKAAADKDYATLQLCLECRPIESVGHQELGYFLAVQKDPLMFNLLFAACETSILAKNNEVADSLIRSLGYCFRDCRSASLSREEVLLIARSKFAEQQPDWFLVEEYLQVSMPFEQRQFDLQDYSNMFKRMREDFKRKGVVWPEEKQDKRIK